MGTSWLWVKTHSNWMMDIIKEISAFLLNKIELLSIIKRMCFCKQLPGLSISRPDPSLRLSEHRLAKHNNTGALDITWVLITTIQYTALVLEACAFLPNYFCLKFVMLIKLVMNNYSKVENHASKNFIRGWIITLCYINICCLSFTIITLSSTSFFL